MRDSLLALRPDHPAHNYHLACMLARLHRPFPAGRIYLERLLQGPDREHYLRRIQLDCDLFRWRRHPSFAAWLAGFGAKAR